MNCAKFRRSPAAAPADLSRCLPAAGLALPTVAPAPHGLATAVECGWPPTTSGAAPQILDEFLTAVAADGFSVSLVAGEGDTTETLSIEVTPPSDTIASTSVSLRRVAGHYVITEWRTYAADRYEHPIWLSERTYSVLPGPAGGVPLIENYRLRTAGSHAGFDPSDTSVGGVGSTYTATLSSIEFPEREAVLQRVQQLGSLALDRGVDGPVYMSEFTRTREESFEHVLEADGTWKRLEIRREGAGGRMGVSE